MKPPEHLLYSRPDSGLSAAIFRRHYRWLALATWILPPVVGSAFEIFLGLISAEELARTIFAGFTGPVIAGFVILGTIALDRRACRITELVEALPDRPETRGRIETAVRRLMAFHLGLFLLYCLGGPQTALLSEYFLYQDRPATTTFSQLFVGMLPPILLITVPLYFLVTDALGRYLAPWGIAVNLASLRFKYLALGLATPILIDLTLILYFRDRTGYFGAEVLFVWSGLLLIAALGTLLAWRSLQQSLSPMLQAVSRPRTVQEAAAITPQSLDELGVLARDWRTALDNERRQEARFRNLVEGSIQGIFVLQNKRIVFANDAFVRMLGYQDTEAVYGLPDAAALIVPDDRERIAGYSQARLEGREAPDRYEVRALRADGSVLWQEVLMRAVMWYRKPAQQITVIDISERKQAEQKLRASEARFRDLIEGSIQGIFVHRNFGLLFANRAMAEMLGYENPEDVLAYGSVLNFTHPDEHARLTGLMDARLAGKEIPERYVFRAVRKDGSPLWVENIARVVNWDGSSAIQATVFDVTERVEAEAALQRSTKSLLNAQRIARIGNWDWHITEGSLNWSEEIYRIFGVEPDAFPATYEAFLGYIHPDDRKAVADAVESALAGANPYAIDHRIVLADGRVKFVHEQAEVVRDQTGQPVSMLGTVQDVTELRKTEEALRRSELSLTNAQRIARVGSFEHDLTNGRLTWSDQVFAIFGIDRADGPPDNEAFMGMVHPEDRKKVGETTEAMRRTSAACQVDFRIARHDGELRAIHMEAETVVGADGNSAAMSGTVQDVTSLREAEAEVRRLNEELEQRVEARTRELRETQAELIKKDRLATLGQLTATVSHEIRNPLGAMRTSAYVLSNSLPAGNETAQRAISRIERGILRCDRIIDELLDFTRSTEIDREPVPIDRWLADLLSEQTIPPGIRIETELRLKKLKSMIDPGRMRRAIINLVDNACQAIAGQDGWDESAGGGLVTVATARTGSDIEIRIADNGPGFADETRDKIFEPLFSTKTFGVGLGLPTVRQVLEQHGGSVAVESEAGAGTTFRLVFQYMEPKRDRQPSRAKSPAIGGG